MPSRFSPRSSRRGLLASIAGAAGLALLLGSSGPDAAAPVATSAPRTVVMEGVAFQPGALTTKAGDPVVWVNKDPFPHTVTSDAFDSRIIAADRSWTYTPKVKGDFPYVCTLHPTMKGTLRVR
jgi:plastocyanin